jgi:septal ring factor EnvC (AmiA/AmiB activator)
MSQTETILLILLGFSLASLIALFMGRLLWTAALRLGARRMQRQMPSSLVGLQTDRDRLRAEYAMMKQRLGARLEETQMKLAEHMAEVARHRNRLHHSETHEARRDAELRNLKEQVKTLEATLADSKAREEVFRHALAAKEETLGKLRKKKGYEAHKLAQEKPAPRPPGLPDDPELRLRQRIDRLSEIARTMGEERGAIEPDMAPPPAAPAEIAAPENGAEIAEKLAETERQMEALESELRKLDAAWDDAEKVEKPVAEVEKTDDAVANPVAEVAESNVIVLPSRTPDSKTGTAASS